MATIFSQQSLVNKLLRVTGLNPRAREIVVYEGVLLKPT